MDQFGVISAGETGESCREFPGARPACRGTPETPADSISCSLRARTEVVIIYRRGCSVRARTRTVCAEGRTWVRARTKLCARKMVIHWTIIYVINVGMIRVYRLKCDSLEMFSVYKCIDVPRMYLYVGLSATSLEMFSMARGAK